VERAFKYHGLGNDFVVLDRRQGGQDIDEATSRALCDRRRGLGADGVLVLLPSRSAVAKMVVHNPDGSVPEMCGNGLRCAVKYLVDTGTERPASLSLETGAGVLACEVAYGKDGAEQIQVAMGPARLAAPHLPAGPSGSPFFEQPLPGHPGLKGSAVSMGNPHLVLWDVPLDQATVLGPKLEHHPLFPQRTNVELTELAGAGLRVVVWERGAGLTEACGTGACASAAIAVKRGLLPPATWFPVELPGGRLELRVAADLSAVDLRGPARFVYEATIELPLRTP
jgi:diaminopimelate epimerase